MRPLLPTEAQKQHRLQETIAASRKKDLEDALQEKRVQIAESEAEFASLLATHRQRWEDEEKAHFAAIDTLKREVAQLEEKKRIAMLPIEDLRIEAENKLQEASNAQESALAAEEKAHRLSESLTEKLDALKDIEEALQKQAQTLDSREEGVRRQENHSREIALKVSESVERLASERKDFEELRERKEAEFAGKEIYFTERARLADSRDIGLNAKETRLDDRIRMYERLIKKAT